MQTFLREGDLVAGKYRVEKVIGEGGMGVVVAAHHLQLDERVAIKLLLPEMLDVPEAVERFTREARAAVKIKNEHVARVFDVGTLDGGAPYMVMEYLEGGDLAAWLAREGPLPVELAVDFVLQACEALAEAHALGIVHRDLKPANLFCTRLSDGTLRIKVLDFGISRVTGAAALPGGDLGLTRTSALVGSPRYMSPEQMQTPRDVDGRTDIWALGIILHELLTGSAPFSGETLPEVCLQVTAGKLPALRGLRSDVPARLDAVTAKCLEKDRQRRHADVAELAAALRPFASDRGRASAERVQKIVTNAAAAASVAPPAPAPAPAAAPARARRIVLAAAIVVGVLGVLVLAGIGVALRRGGEALAPAARVPPPAAPAATAPPPSPSLAGPVPVPVPAEPPAPLAIVPADEAPADARPPEAASRRAGGRRGAGGPGSPLKPVVEHRRPFPRGLIETRK